MKSNRHHSSSAVVRPQRSVIIMLSFEAIKVTLGSIILVRLVHLPTREPKPLTGEQMRCSLSVPRKGKALRKSAPYQLKIKYLDCILFAMVKCSLLYSLYCSYSKSSEKREESSKFSSYLQGKYRII